MEDDYDFAQAYAGLASKSVMEVIRRLDIASTPWAGADPSLGLLLCKVFEDYNSGHNVANLCDEIVRVAEEVLNEN